MTLELRPLGVACNLGCTYCYQEPMRLAGNKAAKYDLDKMLEVAKEADQPIHLFGGEILLMPKADLEYLLKAAYESHGHSGMQTNGTLIDDEHIELFMKYNTSVGVSIDGPNELNILREVRTKRGNDEATIDSTNTIMNNIRKLSANGVRTSIIITLHKMNGTAERLPRLMNFFLWLEQVGVNHGNIHTLEVDKTMPDQEKHVLTQEENSNAFLALAKFFEAHPTLSYNPFRDYRDAMNNKFENLTCYLRQCDPHNTQAVYGIEGDGQLSNCSRTNKEGIDWYKDSNHNYERYYSLYHTPHELHGCKGCRFFMVCSGSCPGEAIDGDFRNKTIHCQTQQALFGYFEKQAMDNGVEPFTQSPYLKVYEREFIETLGSGQFINIEQAIERVEMQKETMLVVEVKSDTDNEEIE